jgi:3-deoxy-D-manno-octulosonic-acid transferase
MYFLYSFLAAAAALLLSPYLLIQGLRRGKYLRSLAQRLGSLPANARIAPNPGQASEPDHAEGAIWIHAVSVGETLAALPLARQLKERFPTRRVVFSTTTETGQQLARERLGFVDAIFYFPLDWTFALRRTFCAVRPAIVVILETEIWPNFLHFAQRNGIPVIFVNGRLSARSFRRYQLVFRWTGILSRHFLSRILSNASLYLMQTKEDADRLLALGAEPSKVQVSGNLKYDQELPVNTAFVDWLESEVGKGERTPVIVAGSVVAHEEPLVLIAFGILQGEWRRALLILAPRKPERFDSAADFIFESKREFIRRSAIPQNQNTPIPDNVSVVLLDSVGELAGLYRIADAVFVGGSLVPAGGHNILEPAAFGKAPIFGPSMENFREVADSFLAARAALQVHSPEDLGVAWIELVKNRETNRQMGNAARALVDSSRGATARALENISKFLEKASDRESAALGGRVTVPETSQGQG